ncbi:MAG: hypothetical protein IMY67_01885 [Bacteroidetes bacterium]|nr:hypothetical protein [Bacteroidota bacterium]
MKKVTYEQLLKEGNDGYMFCDIANNIDETEYPLFEMCAEQYHQAKLKALNKSGHKDNIVLARLVDIKTLGNEFIEIRKELEDLEIIEACKKINKELGKISLEITTGISDIHIDVLNYKKLNWEGLYNEFKVNLDIEYYRYH